ncbi:hypothetical protein HYR99_32945 [Candidatus Poribacteria bacterium]|nr:hypothetical protein [Candidatus Poribacteria bacterium]
MRVDNKIQSAERHEIDPVFKEMLTFHFGQLDIPIQTQVERSEIPIHRD